MNHNPKQIADLIETAFRAAEAKLRSEHSRDLQESQRRAHQTHNAAAILPAEAESYIRHIKALTVARAQTIAEAYTTFGEPSGEAGEADLTNYYKTILSARRGAFQGQSELVGRRTGISLTQLPGLLRGFETEPHAAFLEGKSILAKQSAAFRNGLPASTLINGHGAPRPSSVTAGTEASSDQFDDLLPLLRRRKVFDEDLLKVCSLAGRDGRPLCLVMIDIDHFKKVNDTHGHPVGDDVLVETSRLLWARVDGKGKAYRYGGEELAVLLQNYSPEEATALGEVFRVDVEKATYPMALRLTVSLGLAGLPAHAADSIGLLKAADDALLQAKRLGRNLVRVSGEPESRPEETRIPIRRQPAPSDEQQILREATRAGGQILWVPTDHNGSFIIVGESTYPPMDKLNLFESKKARQMLMSLVEMGLIEIVNRGPHGDEVYELTVKGFEVAGLDRPAT